MVPRVGDDAPLKISFPWERGAFDRRPACRAGLVHGASEDCLTRFSVYLPRGEVTIHESKASETSSPATTRSTIHGDQLRAFDRMTGELRWAAGTDPRVREPAFATPVPHPGGIVVVAADAVHSYAWD